MGEVVVSGSHVLRNYVNDPVATAENKIARSGRAAIRGDVWHRTGDLAIRDSDGSLRLMGRLKDQVVWQNVAAPVFSIERRLQDHEAIAQAALVQAGPTKCPVLYISPEADASAESARKIARELLSEYGFHDVPCRILDALPVDSRHNSKIQRDRLRRRRK